MTSPDPAPARPVRVLLVGRGGLRDALQLGAALAALPHSAQAAIAGLDDQLNSAVVLADAPDLDRATYDFKADELVAEIARGNDVPLLRPKQALPRPPKSLRNPNHPAFRRGRR